MNRVAIVVLNWNGIEDTLVCLDSLLEQSYRDYHIVVIDNGSVDNSKVLLDEYREKHNKRVDVIYNPSNYGFAGGVNTGIRWALKENYDSIALFNNDATADKNWLKHLVEAVEDKEIGIATGLLLHEDGKTIDSSGDWLSTWGLAFPRNRGDQTAKAAESGFVFGASGGASLYKSALFKDIGLFDEDFFAYYEDADISFRTQLAGWKVVYTSKAIAYHKQGATSKKVPGLTLYHTFKNLPMLVLKDVPLRLLFSVGIRFHFAYWLILGNAIAKGNGGPAVKGFFAYIALMPKKLLARRSIQKHKRVSGKYIKSILWPDLPPDQTGLRKLRQIFTRQR